MRNQDRPCHHFVPLLTRGAATKGHVQDQKQPRLPTNSPQAAAPRGCQPDVRGEGGGEPRQALEHGFQGRVGPGTSGPGDTGTGEPYLSLSLPRPIHTGEVDQSPSLGQVRRPAL